MCGDTQMDMPALLARRGPTDPATLCWVRAGMLVGLLAGVLACTQASPAVVFGTGLVVAVLPSVAAPAGGRALYAASAAGLVCMAVALLAGALHVLPAIIMVGVAAASMRDARRWVQRLH
jgi:Co/Zn/Cd efflux system component